MGFEPKETIMGDLLTIKLVFFSIDVKKINTAVLLVICLFNICLKSRFAINEAKKIGT